MFIDKAKINVKGGDGGNGIIAFRREKYVPMGGPSGGDGGKGGSVILIADRGLSTLMDFKYKAHYKGKSGDHGQGSNKYGKSADDTIVRVPIGTVIKDDKTGQLIADLTEHGEKVMVAKGGRGGRGNVRFATSRLTAPKFAEKGEPGQERWIRLELKLIADVGLIGFPNVGKSSLISVVSAAKPKVADYHFTTLAPVLGVVFMAEGQSFVLADIPGLIEGASEGLGLGHAFLRHVERTRLLIHVIDISASEERDPIDDFMKINQELSQYNSYLGSRPQMVALNKCDLMSAGDQILRFKEWIAKEYPDMKVFEVSAATTEGTKDLMTAAYYELEKIPVDLKLPTEEEELFILEEELSDDFTIEEYDDGTYEIFSPKLDKMLNMTYVENDYALMRLHNILLRMGVIDALRNLGIEEGAEVRVGEYIFGFYDEFDLNL